MIPRKIPESPFFPGNTMELIVLSVLVIAALAFVMAHNKQERIDQIDSQNSRYESWFADNRRNELGGIIYIYELEGNRFKIGSTQRSGVVRAVDFQEKYHVNYIPGSVEQLVVPKSFLLEDVENLVRRHFYMSGAYELDLEIGREVFRFGSGNAFDSIVEEWKTVVSGPCS